MTGTRRHLLWSTGVVVVLALMVIAVASVRHAVAVQRTDDPRSTTGSGTRALAQLLTDHGIRLETTDNVADA
ncbi:MAG TPA: hypothetical protein VFP34_15015, partial [Microlunatus sp.]|nr:hypothetical protein [Microlunatus sp.]